MRVDDGMEPWGDFLPEDGADCVREAGGVWEERPARTYRDLLVWQRAMDLAVAVCGLVKEFPAEEQYALCDQLRRASVSVVSNIAEGNGRDTLRDYVRFLAQARGSLNEVETQLEIARRLEYSGDLQGCVRLAQEVHYLLNALMKRLKERMTTGTDGGKTPGGTGEERKE